MRCEDCKEKEGCFRDMWKAYICINCHIKRWNKLSQKKENK